MQFEVLVFRGSNVLEMKENLCRVLNEEYHQAKIVNLEVTGRDLTERMLTAIIEYNFKGKRKLIPLQKETEIPPKNYEK